MTIPSAHAQKKTAPTPVPPDARYAVSWIDSPLVGNDIVRLTNINDYGIVIGNLHYGTQTHPYATGLISVEGETNELNALNHPWYDLKDTPAEGMETGPVGGWLVEFAYGINEAADIVGIAVNIDLNVPVRAFILEDALGSNPRFLLLPTIGDVDHKSTSVNNHRELVGVSGDRVIRYQRNSDNWPYYTPILEPIPRGEPQINDAGVIVSGAYRQLSSGTSPTIFSGHTLRKVSNGIPALNIPAMIGGTRAATSGKNGQAGGAIRLPVGGASATLVYSGANNHSGVINDFGDLCIVVGQFSNPGTGYLYYDPDSDPTNANPYGVNGNGILPLNDLVVTQDPDWLNKASVTLSGINNRDSTGLGQICGTAYYSGQGPRSFVLTPFVPTP